MSAALVSTVLVSTPLKAPGPGSSARIRPVLTPLEATPFTATAPEAGPLAGTTRKSTPRGAVPGAVRSR
ncbi:hypothetical protein ACSCBZ_44055 [Streptomyces niveiscabiei]|uniref:hypothetical protein n=1 Tax=Streptomyces niveiscabiei TaxID=164115 RepID=UPI003EBC2765